MEVILLISIGFIAGYIVCGIFASGGNADLYHQIAVLSRELKEADDTIEYQRRELNFYRDKVFELKHGE